MALLNTDYKIAAKYIAKRIKLALTDCIIQYATEKNIPALLLFIDFEWAFDSLKWSFIDDTSIVWFQCFVN